MVTRAHILIHHTQHMVPVGQGAHSQRYTVMHIIRRPYLVQLRMYSLSATTLFNYACYSAVYVHTVFKKGFVLSTLKPLTDSHGALRPYVHVCSSVLR